MEQNYQNSKFRELLDKLQQESWQLELLISGFAIFGLFSAIEPIGIRYDIAENEQDLVSTILWYAALVSSWILVSNLLIHVILRGLWIGALGLRYISGDIDYNELNYSEKFTNFLQKRIGSFDKYIANLENYCSVLFAVSFLFIFYFLACLLCIVTIILTTFIFIDTDLQNTWGFILLIIGILLILFICFGALLTFIDFISQGFLKRKKWTSKFYFPIYKIFSFITLSFLYRPLVYNFLDNKFGKKLSWILIPIYVGIIFLTTFSNHKSNYLNKENSSSKYFTNANNYDDQILHENDFIKTASIPSKVITDNYLKVFLIYNQSLEDRLYDFNKGLEPKEDRRGLRSSIISLSNSPKKIDSLRTEYYKTLNDTYKIYIDKNKHESDFIATTNKYKRLGFETFLDIDTLSYGKHFLEITRKRIRKKDTLNPIIVTIPFWKFKK
ncbi:hypothetical protein KO506_16145 [Polaribacter vadi]|uniref:hypothetical protein n=1 Tax=Polaribacter TaxID=52959 RepID=UPI001C086E63|nr:MULTISPECIES: hypothetical protein [Polaribacter]MBU3012944.1 hypothetical protein [Polaribacter vadi]MDO6742762.1 hypothetical protein [Polaribacter sp. 1_MG-2023]